MRINKNPFLGFALSLVIYGNTHVRGDLVCTTTPSGVHQVEPGSTLNLTCFGRPRSGQVLVWFKDGKTITSNVTSIQKPGSKVRSMVTLIQNASTADSGRYECRDQGGSSHDVCEWRLDVFAPPSIKLISPSSENMIGATSMINCKASGYPLPVYKWLFNGLEVTNHTGVGPIYKPYLKVKSKQHESNLRIQLATRNNNGNYTCIASNSRGQDEKSTTMVFRNPVPVVHIAKYMVLKSRWENVSLRCLVSDIFQTRTIVTWTHNNRQLVDHKEHFFDNNTVVSMLRIHNASDEDVGVYWCHVKVLNMKERGNTRLIRAEEGLPSVVTEQPIVTSRLGKRLTLFCTVTYPRYDVIITTSWTKNGSVLSHPYTSGYSTMETPENNSKMFSLTIKNFTLDDVGTYVCRAETTTGTNWTSIEVKIQSHTVQKQLSSSEARVPTFSLDIIFLVAALGSIFALATVITIRYLYRVKPKKLAARNKHCGSSHEYKYESFLSFSNQDCKWTTTYLIPLLDKYSFKYCVTRKDFEVGKAMIENIADSIYQSRTVIAIVSKNFMKSNHCQQELDLALYKSAELDDGSLIVIRIDSIEKSLLPKALRNRTFLDYADMEERKHWERRLLKCLLSHTRNSTE